MQLPLQITFRSLDPSPAIEADVRKKAKKLDQFYNHIMACRVVVESHHKHHHKGNLYHVRIDLTVPDNELVVSHEPHEHHAHEDAYVAVRDAFDAARRQLEDYVRRRDQRMKRHRAPPHGRISQLHAEDDYGTIETLDGREMYFHRNSLLNADFANLVIGTEVRFAEEAGDLGPQASTVRVIGKHHILG